MGEEDLWPQLKDSGLTLLRFPGCNWGDELDVNPFNVDMYFMDRALSRITRYHNCTQVALRWTSPVSRCCV